MAGAVVTRVATPAAEAVAVPTVVPPTVNVTTAPGQKFVVFRVSGPPGVSTAELEPTVGGLPGYCACVVAAGASNTIAAAVTCPAAGAAVGFLTFEITDTSEEVLDILRQRDR